MKLHTCITAACVLTLCVTNASAAEPRCPSTTDEHPSGESAWRHRLAAWVPNVTFEISSETAEQSAGHRRADLQNRAKLRLGLPASATWRDDFNRQLDWQVAAHWDVVELVQSLSPLPRDDSDTHTECDARVGAPAYLEIEEDP